MTSPDQPVFSTVRWAMASAHLLAVLLDQEVDPVAAHELLGRDAENPLDGRIRVCVDVVGVARPHPLLRRLDEGAELGLALADGGLGALALGDVLPDGGEAHDLARRVADGRIGERDVDIRAVLAVADRLELDDAASWTTWSTSPSASSRRSGGMSSVIGFPITSSAV